MNGTRTLSRATRESANPDESLQIVMLPLAQIEVGERLRAVDEDYAACIAASMDEIGPTTPIQVRTAGADGRHVLIAGGHRYRAAEIAGIEALPATIHDVDDLQAQLREIDENLIRRELSALDRAIFLAARKAVWEELYPETRHGGDRKSDQVANLATWSNRFTAEAADKLGMGERSIRRAVARYNDIAPDIRRDIANTELANKGSELDALGRLAPALQRDVVDHMLAQEVLPKVADAVSYVRGDRAPAVRPEELEYQRLITAWNKASQKARRRFQDYLAENEDPRPGKRRAA